MSKYSEADFRKAQFARTEDGLVAMRAFPGEYKSWIFVTTKGTTALRTDSSMPREDWIPVTGRTIKRNVVDHYLSGESEEWRWGFGTALALAEVEIVPDPEPTNAEKLAADMDDWYAKNKDTRPTLTDHLIERGWVKAPGGDDE